ncbi:beclin-1-like Atg6 isoform X1 [Tachypleus tridentatus]|uniref:beclin-1-like Atg6 isoform X1 n=2 Tax=Tachypleus tridentatus TaxID=6853 RepID=UPI003FCFCC51
MASSDKVDRTFGVNYVCQRCCQPLKLDSSFGSLDDQTFSELSAPMLSHSNSSSTVHLLQNDHKGNGTEEYEISRKYIAPVRLTESGNGFLMVGDSSAGTTESLGHHLRVTSRLFDIMSDQSDVDHPLCEECTDSLLDQMDQQLKIAEDECKDYREFVDQLNLCEENEEDLKILEEELKELEEKEIDLRTELQHVTEEQAKVQDSLIQQQQEKEKLQAEEERYWHEYSDLKRQLLFCEDDQRSVDNQLRYAQTQLDKLKKTNVFNATFHIWHSGHFGTINNFRLGRLPSAPVDWTEINAAWGQTVLLLHSLAKKMNLTFQRYRLVPYGNHSFLESIEDRSKELPLYGSGGFKFFWDTKFDQAMVAFLDCLQQFKEEVEKGDTGFCLPYRMEKGKIEDTTTGIAYSIKIQFNSEEQWTKALKFMLTNLKWGLAWVSSQFDNK